MTVFLMVFIFITGCLLGCKTKEIALVETKKRQDRFREAVRQEVSRRDTSQ